MPTSLEVPQLVIHQPALDEAEAARLAALSRLIEAAEPLRDLAPAVRELFPAPAYEVGCGGAHVWLHRQGETQRLAFIS